MFFSAAAGTGTCDRGAAAKGSLLEYDPGPQPPSHGTQCAFCRGGVPRRVAPAPQQGVPGREQAGQCCPAQRLVVMELYHFKENAYHEVLQRPNHSETETG